MVDALRNFFDLNSALVFFTYGQVFFILGLAIALQSRRHSRLAMARTLRWLSVFGLVHGLHEWGVFFIPLQAQYMSTPVLNMLLIIQAMLLVVSFTALFQFGAELLRERWPWLSKVPVTLLLAWIVLATAWAVLGDPSIGEWQQIGSIMGRYFIGFPGAVLSALGLRYHSEHQIASLGLTQIYRGLRVAAMALFGYAILAGLIVNAGSFFPASWFNDSLTLRYLGIPVPVFRSLTGMVLLVTIVRALEVFDLEIDSLIEEMEIEQSLVAERERIGRELHDGAIQQAYTAGLIVESARNKLGLDSPIGQRLERAITTLDQAIVSLRAYMHELRPGPANADLVLGLKSLAADPRYTTLIDIDLVVEGIEPLSMNAIESNHVLAIAGEALSNVIRHANARRVQLRASRQEGLFLLEIRDDGRGFEISLGEEGYGLRNMRDRARLLGGKLTLTTERGKSTQVNLAVPWEET